MPGRVDRRGRLLALLVLFCVVATASGLRLAYWQVAMGDQLAGLARSRLETRTVEPAHRGAIYDRTGTVLLATTAYRDQLVAYPAQVPPAERAALAARISKALGFTGERAAAIAGKLTAGSGYVILANELSEAQSKAIRAAMASGTVEQLDLVPRAVRVYPNPGGAPGTTLASQLVGFVNRDGDGQYGVEQRYQALLAGRDRVVVAELDVAGRPVADATGIQDAGAPGSDIRLTLEAGLQLQVEKELYATWVADKATSASAVVMDASSGAILAWASTPGYDANKFQAQANRDASRFIDPIASEVYEPGSVMKMFVAAAAYEDGVVKASTKVNDSGTLRIGEERVDDSDRKAMGSIRFEDVIAYSRNVGVARVARMLGNSVRDASVVLYRTWSRLGIGRLTGIDVAGEVPGLVSDPAIQPWQEIDLANRSFGQGVAVTLVQLARAYAAMVNGGVLVQPHVVEATGNRSIEQQVAPRVIGAGLSKQLVTLLRHVVTEVPWYAKGTLIPGYAVGGKTGTAQIWDAAKKEWVGDTYNFTFVGYFGRTKPEYVVAVLIDHAKPKIIRQGVMEQAVTSNELFRRIARDAIQVLDMPPASSSSAPATPGASTAPGGSSASPGASASALPQATPRVEPAAAVGVDGAP
jgi:cell division protein FtsI (penicillin-binding protein 3)